MKKIYSLFVLVGLLLASCDKDDDFVEQVSHTFEVKYNENYGRQAASGVALSLTSAEEGRNYTATTGEGGKATVTLSPGTYTISATKTFSPEEYLAFSGQESDGDVVFNASLQNVAISAGSTGSTPIEIVSGKIGDLIIKQIYYAGSDIKKGASYRDQFIELHNNANETLYLDGLCFAQIKGTTKVRSKPKDYLLPNGQYDWSKSLGNTVGAAANTSYVYAEEVIRIPGTGSDYPLESGKSVIIAATAVNHKQPLVVIDDQGETVTYEIPNPELTVDLSRAPFEAYFRPYQENNGLKWLDSDIDNPSAVDVEVVFKSFKGKDLILDPNGRDAFVIFYATDDLVASWSKFPLPNISEIQETTSMYLQIPNAQVIDGVDLQHVSPTRSKPKRLPDSMDGGNIAGKKGAYTSESVIRKVRKTVEGRTYYQDTNNSSNDFEVLDHPRLGN